MESFVWGNIYETGIEEVDQQHQSLVELINRFGRQLTENEVDLDQLENIFIDLADYAREHFEDEERLMRTVNVDDRHLNSHIEEHNGFLEDVSSLYKQYQLKSGGKGESLLKFLLHWLAYHILGADKNMGRQIIAINKGRSPGRAFEDEEQAASDSTEPLLVALNGLFKQVSLRNKELVELNLSLEDMVAKRTEELEQALADLEIIASTDVLTELPNRRHGLLMFQSLWRESLNFSQPISCMMIDADGFKEINDNYGHDAGDIVLQKLARELHHSVRSDDVVCRLGGDEFLIVCPNTDLEGALHLAEIVRQTIAALRVEAGAGVWHGSISVGVATRQSSTSNIEELLKVADESVYLAKQAGRNCVRAKDHS